MFVRPSVIAHLIWPDRGERRPVTERNWTRQVVLVTWPPTFTKITPSIRFRSFVRIGGVARLQEVGVGGATMVLMHVKVDSRLLARARELTGPRSDSCGGG